MRPCVGLVLIFVAYQVHAIPVNFSENGGAGDLGYARTAGNTFIFDEGANRISGATSIYISSIYSAFDLDYFYFYVPENMVVDSIRYTASSVSSSNLEYGYFDFYLFDCALAVGCTGDFFNLENTGAWIGREFQVDALNPVDIDAFSSLALTGGLYGITSIGVFQWEGEDEMFSLQHYNWEITLSSISVPEPGTLGLMGLALAGMAFTRRRTHAR